MISGFCGKEWRVSPSRNYRSVGRIRIIYLALVLPLRMAFKLIKREGSASVQHRRHYMVAALCFMIIACWLVMLIMEIEPRER